MKKDKNRNKKEKGDERGEGTMKQGIRKNWRKKRIRMKIGGKEVKKKSKKMCKRGRRDKWGKAYQEVGIAIDNCPELENSEVIEATIVQNPTLKQRLLSASIATTIETIKMFLPPVGIAIEAVKAYQNPWLIFLNSGFIP